MAGAVRKVGSDGYMIIIAENRNILNLRESEIWFNLSYVFLEGELRIIQQKQGQVKGRGGGRQPMDTEKHITEEKRELYRYQARNRAGQNIYYLVRENNLKKMWTLTYAENMQDRQRALRDFENFIKRLNYQIGRKINYVAVIEHQKRGAIHFHMAMEDFYIKKDYFQEIWTHGNVAFSTYKDGRKIEKSKQSVAHYMMKYLKKDMKENPQLTGKKMYLNSKGLKRPPKGNGVANEKIFKGLETICHTYDIKGKENLKGYKLNTTTIPNQLDINRLSHAIK